MDFLNLHPKILQKFPLVKTFFVIGKESDLTAAASFLSGRPGLKIVTMAQTHGATVRAVENDKGSLSPVACDGCYTSGRSLGLSVRTADCLPILFYNKRARVVGAIHSGWRGTLAGILTSAVKRVFQQYDTGPEDFYFYFGPAAQKCCYEVQADVAEQFVSEFGLAVLRQEKNHDYLDLAAVNKLQLRGMGVPAGQIEDSGICTIHNSTYPSWRRRKVGGPELISVIYQT